MLSVDRDRPSLSTLVDYSPSLLAPTSGKELEEKFLEACEPYKVTERGIPFINTRERTTEYFYQTHDQGKWKLRLVGLPSMRYTYVNGNMPEMLALEQTLEERQMFQILSSPEISQSEHGRVQYFLAANQELLDQILTSREPLKRGKRQSRIFVEPHIPHPREDKQITPDMLQIGSDNRVRVFEVGNAAMKARKTLSYAEGVKTLYQGINQAVLPDDRVLAYVLKFAQEDGIDTVSLFDAKYLKRIYAA